MPQLTNNQELAPLDDPTDDLWNELWDENLEFIDLDTLVKPPPPWRKRLFQSALVLAALAATFLALWNVIWPAKPQPPAPLPTPVAPRPIAVIVSNINYGTVTIDGVRQKGALPLLTMVHHNKITIKVDAPPFVPTGCSFSGISFLEPGFSSIGPCQLSVGNFGPVTLHGVTSTPAYMITIFLGVSALPPQVQDQARALVTQALSTHQDTVIPAGSYFATGINQSGTITSQRASTPLTASAISSTNLLASQACHDFCPWELNPSLPLPSAGPVWAISAPATLHWRFTWPSGKVAGVVSLPDTVFVNLFLSYHAATGWQVLYPPGTVTIKEQLAASTCTQGRNILQSQVRGRARNLLVLIDHNAGIEGCTLRLQVNSQDAGLFIWRFGVLLAADARARAWLPSAPAAPPAEIAAIGKRTINRQLSPAARQRCSDSGAPGRARPAPEGGAGPYCLRDRPA
jgi:hypothetical protein